MKIIPSYQFSVFEEECFPEKMAAASQMLDPCRREGIFAGFDGKPLYYEYFQAQESRGAVVVLHGLSEFTKKYHEFAWYLLNQGFDVFLYDQRCHGRSCRLTDDPSMIHVDSFSDYCKDLHCFVTDVVRTVTDGPLYLYSHSMGSATALNYLSQYPEVFQKAVLSAPMLEPLTGPVNPTVARLGLSAYTLFVNGKKKFWSSAEFDPEYPFSRSHDQSLARFQRNMDIRLSDAHYRTTPLSLRWVLQSLKLRKRLLNKRFISQLQTPLLMLCADRDDVVNQDLQTEFAEKCPVCRRIILKNTTHGMLCETSEHLAEHIRLVLDHFC